MSAGQAKVLKVGDQLPILTTFEPGQRVQSEQKDIETVTTGIRILYFIYCGLIFENAVES